MKFSVDVFIDPGHFKNSVIHILGTLCYLFLDGTLKTQTGVQENSISEVRAFKAKSSSHTEQANAYKESFTIHGLSKVFTGTICERVFWFLVLACCLGIVAFVSHGFYKQYSDHDFRTEIRMVDIKEPILPALLVCNYKVNFKKRELLTQGGTFCFNGIDSSNRRCNESSRFKGRVKHLASTFYKERIQVSESSATDAPGNCIQLNREKRALHPNKSAPLITIIGLKTVTIHAREPDDFPASFLAAEFPENGYHAGKYVIKIKEKATIRRLKSPYQSNCTDGTPESNVFPGNYTRDKCKRTCMFHKMLNECGGVPDVWKKYLRADHVSKLNKNQSQWWSIPSCFEKEIIEKNPTKDCYCPLPCHEVTYKLTVERIYDSYELNVLEKRVNKFENWLKYIHEKCSKNHSHCWDTVYENYTHKEVRKPWRDRIKFWFTYDSFQDAEISEFPVYPIEQFFSDIGGWMSLLVGMSALSLVELLAFFFFSITSFILLRQSRTRT